MVISGEDTRELLDAPVTAPGRVVANTIAMNIASITPTPGDLAVCIALAAHRKCVHRGQHHHDERVAHLHTRISSALPQRTLSDNRCRRYQPGEDELFHQYDRLSRPTSVFAASTLSAFGDISARRRQINPRGCSEFFRLSTELRQRQLSETKRQLLYRSQQRKSALLFA
jgi:hypothetical protein